MLVDTATISSSSSRACTGSVRFQQPANNDSLTIADDSVLTQIPAAFQVIGEGVDGFLLDELGEKEVLLCRRNSL